MVTEREVEDTNKVSEVGYWRSKLYHHPRETESLHVDLLSDHMDFTSTLQS